MTLVLEMYSIFERTKNMSKAHPGFAKVASSIARKQGISKEAAGAILANSSRHASASAKRKNPHLKRVVMKKKST